MGNEIKTLTIIAIAQSIPTVVIFFVLIFIYHDEKFHVTNKYELPIASGMKIIVRQEENEFSLKDIEVNKKKIDKEKEYSILLTDTTMSVLKKINSECEIRQLGDTTLSSAWTTAMANGQQPSAPEDYIEVEK